MILIRLDTHRIIDWGTFHDAFAEAFGFPGFYGRNMDAWIDCMTYLDDPTDSMTAIPAPPGGVVTLQLEHVEDFARRCPEQFEALIDCAAFVNWRRIELGEDAMIALSYRKSASAISPPANHS